MYKLLLLMLLPFLTGCSNRESDQKKMTDTLIDLEKNSNTLTAGEISEGWKLLFDGESTQGWRGFKKDSFPKTGWQVKDGMLMVEYSGKGEAGNGGDIITLDQYGDFELKLEWKISAGGNSGIIYRVTESDNYDASWNTAPEVQVLDDFGYEKYNDGYVINLKQMSGANYDLHAPSFYYTKPVGEWNQVYIKVQGSHVEQWMNGQKTVEYELWSPEWKILVEKSKFSAYPDYGLAKTGHIALQDHGHSVWFRHIRIREL